MTRWTLIATGIAVVVLGAGCGGEEQSATESWADDVCSASQTWRASVTEAAEGLQNLDAGSDEPIRDALDDVRAATEQLSDDLSGLGAPETEDGEQARELVATLADDVSSTVEAAAQALSGADSVAEVAAAVPTIATAFAALQTQLQATLDALQGLDPGGELDRAFQDADSCEELRDEG